MNQNTVNLILLIYAIASIILIFFLAKKFKIKNTTSTGFLQKKEKIERIIKAKFWPRDLIFGYVIFRASIFVVTLLLLLFKIDLEQNVMDKINICFVIFFLLGPDARRRYYKNRLLSMENK